MTYDIRELSPTSQYVGTLPPGWIDEILTPTPFGSVADDSDATYTELGARWIGFPDNTRHASVLSMDFHLTEPFDAAFMHMMIQAKNTAWHQANQTVAARFWVLYMQGDSVLDSWTQFYSSSVDNSYQLAPVVGGHVAEPTWFRFNYLGGQHDVNMAEPDGDTWMPLGWDLGGYSGGTMLDCLNGDGLRVVFFAANDEVDSGWRDFFDVFEVRMVLATAPSAGVFDPPCLRNVQRGDGLGFSSAPRAIQNNSVQGSLRNFGFN